MTSIQDILTELYQLDPTLKEHEPMLKKLITKLQAERPDITPNPQFVRELRGMLLQRAATTKTATHSSSAFFDFLSRPAFGYAFVGVMLGIIVAGPSSYFLFKDGATPLPSSESDGTLFSYAVNPTSDKAFGDLSQAQPQNAAMGRGGAEASTTAPAPMADVDASNKMRPQSGGGGPSTDMMIYPPIIYDYEYVLSGSGTLPELTDTEIDVLQRQKNPSSVPLSAIASKFNTPFLNLSSFDDAIVDNVTFVQRGSKGYMITVSAREGSISVNQNWETWPHPENNCRDEACYARYRLDPSDIPADDVLINVAKNFMADHGIDLSHYGEPEVDHQWKVDYERTVDKSMAWVPDTQRVIFPLLVEGKVVYDESGNKSGLSVGVNVREKAVSDLYGIMDQTYLASKYDAVTDTQMIQDYIKTIDAQQYMPFAAEGQPEIERKKVMVHLGTPTMSYATYYLYNDNDGSGKELVVPSLVFPVERVEGENAIWRKAIVVPLASDLLKQRMEQNTQQPIPMDGGVMR